MSRDRGSPEAGMEFYNVIGEDTSATLNSILLYSGRVYHVRDVFRDCLILIVGEDSLMMVTTNTEDQHMGTSYLERSRPRDVINT
jgi:hypothetical protein